MAKSSGQKLDRQGFIENLSPDTTFHPPATESEIANVETSLGVHFPADLKMLLLQSNGVQGEYGLGLIWSTDRIVNDNLMFRTNFKTTYMPFDTLLFFADAGNGDQFAFPILSDGASDNQVYAWNHEDDSRKWVADSLQQYLDWWLTGRLTL